MKYFTKAQIEEIRKQLATMGVRDTDLPDVTAPLSGSELVAIVQNGENRKVGVRKLIHDYLPDNIADGEDGASAYDVWKSQPGNEGKSVEQFLESLKGAKGDTGATGPTGPAGAAGARGADGAAGAAAGFGTPTASVDTTEGGQLGVSITASGPDTAKIFNFVFHNLVSGGGGGGTTPTDTGKVMYSSQATNPGNPDDNPNLWHQTRTSYDVWMAFCFLVNGSWGDWTILYIGDIDVPYASFKSFAFTRATSQPNAPTGGNYSSPTPTTAGWYDGIPAGSGAIWMSSRIFASDGTHSDANWSTPRLLADNEFMDYEFSSAANPGVPSKATPSSAETNPNWSNEATESTIWMGMREISNGAYKAGSTWMVVKIKGEDGKDGTSVTIKGTVSSVGDLPSTGNITGDGYLVNGNLYVWDGDSWENCGQIQGPPGADGDTPYIHIKYSNDGGAHFTANDGEDPGDYIGLYWDYTAEDSSSVSSYTWKYWKGEDGFGYEYIFKLTTTNTAPNLPSTSPNTDDYIPTSEGWTDDPGGVSAEYPYCWVAWRKKEDGVWSAWHGTTNGKARLYSHCGQDGTDGTDGIDGKDALPIRIRDWSEIGGVTLTGDDKVFSGYEEWVEGGVTKTAPFRDVIVITPEDYPSGIPYPFTIVNPIGTGSVGTPVLFIVNYSSSYSSGFSGTNLSLPTSSTYTNTIPSNKEESAILYGQGRVYSMFQNLGAVYARILVATQAYIGNLTVRSFNTAGDDTSINKKIAASGNTLYMTDANGDQRFVLTGDDISTTTPTAAYSPSNFSFSETYTRPGNADYSGTSSTIEQIFTGIGVGQGDTVSVPSITLNASLFDSHSGTSEGAGVVDLTFTTKLYNGNIEVRTLSTGTMTLEGNQQDSITLAAVAPITGLTTSSAYSVRVAISISYYVPVDNNGGYIRLAIGHNTSSSGNLTVYGDKRIAQVGANGMSIHLGGNFDAIFALDSNDDPLICLQGRNSNNEIVGIRISSAGFQVSTNGTWRTPNI